MELLDLIIDRIDVYPGAKMADSIIEKIAEILANAILQRKLQQ
jgi:hypothetical protein